MTIHIQHRLYSRDFAQNVHQYYRLMREHQPVFRGRFSRFRSAYLITRYDDVLNLLRDERVIKNPKNVPGKSSSGVMWMPQAFRPLMQNMLNTDEPDHRRLRNLVHMAFTPKMIAELEPQIQALADRLVDQLERDLRKGPVDLVKAFALPLPVNVIADMVGIPPEDRRKITRMTDCLLDSMSLFGMLRAVPAINAFSKYARQLSQIRREAPQDDLMTALVQSEAEGDRFTEDELVGMTFLLTVAGHETTVGLITNAVLALVENSTQKQLLIDHLDDEDIVDSAVEEFLRYDGPLSTTEMSFAKSSINLHGVTIPRGAVILNAILSANRDSSAFDRADEFDIRRSPNKHLAFGHGIHYCLGAPLARLETKIAIVTLLRRLPDLRLAQSAEKVRYRPIFVTHRPERLLVM